MRMGHIILAALCLWSCVLTVTPLLTEEQVGRATNYIEQQFTKNFNYQYAYFVKFTADECNRGLTFPVLEEALKGENADNLFQTVNNYEIYEGNRIVAAASLQYEKKQKYYDEHSEYRLLNPNNASPISRLLQKTPLADCAIFYSLNSPCISKCIAPEGTYNIIRKLEVTIFLPENKAFAFGKVYRDDVGKPEIWDSWRTFNNYMPLYRCNGNNCVHCFTNGVQQEECMNPRI